MKLYAKTNFALQLILLFLNQLEISLRAVLELKIQYKKYTKSLTLPESNDSNSISTRNELESFVNINRVEHMAKSDIFPPSDQYLSTAQNSRNSVHFLRSERYKGQHVQIH